MAIVLKSEGMGFACNRLHANPILALCVQSIARDFLAQNLVV